ncbi:TorF family putative porin [Variovorax terrae]|uniref:TorF family putative porin n=1 Tax=Variovorax terrae TaxID=2923278 RepID=A0A9X1VWX1_9BURK|nr:TorF family putative porin [Variovorax terrae]MCJ0764755.1 TorF family putative porin [Variovorax terrae]
MIANACFFFKCRRLLAASLLCAAVSAQAQTANPGEPAPVHSLTGNLSLVSDYRFRGLSQSWRQPAVQGGIDYTHASGLYLGNWNSSVSSNSYNNGAGLEVDLYGGYRFPLTQDLTADAGVLFYLYPGAHLNSAPAQPGGQKYDNTEIYFGLARGAFNARLSYAVTDYFGLNSATAGYAYWTPLPARGSSRGTTYLDLNYSLELGRQFALGLHLGHTAVRRYGELSYTDYKLALTKEAAGFLLGLALVGARADARYYQAGDSAWLHPKPTGRSSLVLSATRSF